MSKKFEKIHPKREKESSHAKAFNDGLRKGAIFGLEVAVFRKRCKLGPSLLLIAAYALSLSVDAEINDLGDKTPVMHVRSRFCARN